MTIGLSAAQLVQVFPFHFVCDASMRLVQAGRSLSSMVDVEPGCFVDRLFEQERPRRPLDFQRLRGEEGRMVLLRDFQGRFTLRGEVVVMGDYLAFLGTPWVQDVGELAALNLRLESFAPHDSLPDQLFVLATRDASLRDAVELEHRLRARKDTLERTLSELNEQRTQTQLALEESREKSSFLAGMSHELRTPLNAVIGYTELLMEEAGEEPLQDYGIRRYGSQGPTTDLQRILWASRHLLSLINDVLDLAKVEAGRTDVSLRPVGLRGLVGEALAAVRPMVDVQGITVVLAVEDAIAVTDGRKVKQILINLLSNAVRASRCESLVVSVAQSDSLVVKVQDDGIGMPGAVLDKLFRPYVQGTSPDDTRRAGGTGLGLAISRALARAMGGDLTVTSAMGDGSTFRLDLPITTADS